MDRKFDDWFTTFRESIATYKYYIDFNTVYKNAQKYKIELNILNSLIWSKDIEKDFRELIKKYPNVIKSIPIMLAVRQSKIFVVDDWIDMIYDFNKMNYTEDQYIKFMKETGLFDLLENHIINNCFDYITWVETWLNSNARKNRWGDLMENVVESFILKEWFKKDTNYFKEITATEVEKKFWINLNAITDQLTTVNKKWEKTEKRFDFVIKTDKSVYWIEANFYSSGGSKLNETARSYKMISKEADEIQWFTFVRFTDWKWRKDAKNNLRETFNVLKDLYNINDMKNWIMKKIFK